MEMDIYLARPLLAPAPAGFAQQAVHVLEVPGPYFLHGAAQVVAPVVMQKKYTMQAM